MVYISHSYHSISTIIKPKTKLSCHVIVRIYTITMVCVIFEHHSHLKCTWLHWRLLFVSMSKPFPFGGYLINYTILSLKLGNLHVNQKIYRSHDQSCRFHFLLFPSFCLPPALLSVLEVLFLFAEVQKSLSMMSYSML